MDIKDDNLYLINAKLEDLNIAIRHIKDSKEK